MGMHAFIQTHTDIHAYIHPHRLTFIHTCMPQAGGGRQAGRQIDRLTDRQTFKKKTLGHANDVQSERLR